jgi:hypothetical protein
MSKEATDYFIEDWGDKRPIEIILRYDETELSMTPEDVGRTMQAYADSQLIEYTKQLMEYTHESKTILGHDERSAKDFVNIFKEQLKTK